MAVTAYSGIRSRLRNAVRDSFDLQWPDAALDEIIDGAQRECAIFTGALIGEIEFTANGRGVYSAPDDFIEPVRFVAADGGDVPVLSWRALAHDYGDFRHRTGDRPAAVCFDFEGFGQFRVYPMLPAGAKLGTLYYRRLAEAGKLEMHDTDAIEEHALYQLFGAERKEQFSNHYDRFLSLVRREARSNLTTCNRRPVRGGLFY